MTEQEYTPPMTEEECQEIRVAILSGNDPSAEEFGKFLESTIFFSRTKYAKTVSARKDAEAAARGNRKSVPTLSQKEIFDDY